METKKQKEIQMDLSKIDKIIITPTGGIPIVLYSLYKWLKAYDKLPEK